MGNLALKCEAQWQERKVVTSCVGRGTVDVQVMKADGSEVEEFETPVIAAQVMFQFPGYAVVHSSRQPNTKLGKRGQVRVLQRYEVLSPGETYTLFPIPIEVAKNQNLTARRCRRMQSSKDRLSLLLRRSGMETTTTAVDSAEDPKRPLRGEDKSSNDRRSDGVEETELLPFPGLRGEAWQRNSVGEEDQTSENEDEKIELVKPDVYLSQFFAGSSWRPALLSIPESPIGFHSRPGSPMTPITFRIVLSGSLLEKDQPK